MKRKTVRLDWSGREAAPPPARMKFQRVAEIHPGRPGSTAADPHNRLLFGDNLPAMQSLLPGMAGKFRLIYADPPFATQKGFSRRIGRAEDSRKPDTWKLGEGYADQWDSMDSYLSMLQPRLACMRDLLAEDGTFFLHLDWRAVHYAKVLLDELYGPAQFLNEIIWVYHGPSPVRAYFNRKHDTILAYSKGRKPLYHPDRVRIPYNPSTRKTFASSRKAGFGKQPDLDRGKVPEDWWYFPVVARLHTERTGFPTQKPEALLERIIRAASDEGDWIGDFFCGSGTTLRVADTLGRRWVGCDRQMQSIATCQRRLALGRGDAYSIEIAAGMETDFRGKSRLRCAVETDGRKTVVSIAGFSPCGPEGFPDSLDYWEADFDYNGTLFCGTAHAARPWRKGEAPTVLSHSYARGGIHKVACRAVSASGDIGWWESTVKLPEEPGVRKKR